MPSYDASSCSPPYMEPEVSLTCSQESSTGPHPEPHVSCLHPHTHDLSSILILFIHECLVSSFRVTDKICVHF
jgi:hypothetical protein